jgi:hypothetical protein
MSDRLLPQLDGKRLRQTRAVALVVGLLTVALYTAGVPLYFRDLAQGCVTTDCGYGLAFTPSPEQIAALGLSVPAYALALTVTEVMHAWLYFAVAALVFWRVPGNRVAFLGAVFLLCWGATFSNPLYALAAAVPPVRLLSKLLAFTSFATLFAFFSVFPSGTFVPRPMRYLLVAWSVIVGAVELGPEDAQVSDNPVLIVATLVALLGFFLSLIIAQIYRYWRVSTPVEREQTKWVVYGVTVAILGFVTMLVVGGFSYETATAGLIYHLGLFGATLVIPLALLRAVLQSGLWSIDLIIRRTLTYALLTAALVVVYFMVVVVLQAVVAVATGETRSTLVTVLSTLAIAALFTPLRRWAQAWIDRRFYRHKYDAARTLAAFGATVRDDVDLDALVGRLLGVVEDTMQPAEAWLWLHPEARQAPEPAAGGGGVEAPVRQASP